MNRQEAYTADSARSISGLWHQLTHQLSTLLRQELTLARTELYQSFMRLLSSVGAVLVGVAFLYIALLSLLVAGILGLAQLMPIWAAALCIGVVTAGIGSVLLQRGRRLLGNAHLTPRHSQQSLRKDKDVLLRRDQP